MLVPAAGKVYCAVAKQGRRHGERRSAHHEHVGGDHAMEGNAQAGGPLDTVLAVVDDHVLPGHVDSVPAAIRELLAVDMIPAVSRVVPEVELS